MSDEEAYRAMRTIMERTKVVPELAASCTLAAAQALGGFDSDSRVVLLLCGGNVSAADVAAMESDFS